MSDPSTQKPDLDDNTNVITDAAAANRENHMLTEGAEPISLWVILGSAIVVLLGGGVLFGGGLFDYKNFVKQGYVRAEDPNKPPAAPTPKPALEAYIKAGEKLAKASCLTCHGPAGEGMGDTPPLAKSEWVTGPSLRPALIILNGCKGPITVAGKSYNGNMPAQGSGLGPRELAGIMTYIRNSFGNETGKVITTEMAQDALDTSTERNGGQMTAEELDAKYKRDLKGAELDPNTLVDPKTLEPAAAEGEAADAAPAAK